MNTSRLTIHEKINRLKRKLINLFKKNERKSHKENGEFQDSAIPTLPAAEIRSLIVKATNQILRKSNVHISEKNLVARIADEIQALAANEPCGIRGCNVTLYRKLPHVSPRQRHWSSESVVTEKIQEIGNVKIDNQWTTTFEIKVVFNEDLTAWTRFRSALSKLLAKVSADRPPYVCCNTYDISVYNLYRLRSNSLL